MCLLPQVQGVCVHTGHIERELHECIALGVKGSGNMLLSVVDDAAHHLLLNPGWSRSWQMVAVMRVAMSI